MRLGTALVGAPGLERRLLVAPLPSDPGRLVDLHAVEAQRLRKLGEGQPQALAEALVPPSLRRLLEAGPRALARAAQTLAFAEKWARRGTLPSALAPVLPDLRLLPCLARPSALRHPDGSFGDRLAVQPPEARLPWAPGLPVRPTLAAIGQASARPAGFALALKIGEDLVLGAWLHTEILLEGSLSLQGKAGSREQPLAAWADLTLPPLRPGEVLLLPFPEWEPLHPLPGERMKLETPFGSLAVRFGREGTHPTLQEGGDRGTFPGRLLSNRTCPTGMKETPMRFTPRFTPILLLAATAAWALPAAADLQIGPRDTAKALTLEVGRSLTVRLPAQPGTGHAWKLLPGDAAVLEPVGEPTMETPATAKPGGEEVQVFHFLAKGAGKAALTFQYGRDWEKGSKPVHTRTFNVVVRAAS